MLMLAVLACAAYIGCKQSEGDRCQVNEDCKSGVCNQANGLCAVEGDDEPIDAAVPDAIDAPAPPVDAATDAMIDATTS
jgi:hypothetical protein